MNIDVRLRPDWDPKNEKTEYGLEKTKYGLFVDGTCLPIESAEVLPIPNWAVGKPNFRLNIADAEVGRRIFKLSWSEIPNDIAIIDVDDYFGWIEFPHSFVVDRELLTDAEKSRLIVYFYAGDGRNNTSWDILAYYQAYDNYVQRGAFQDGYKTDFSARDYGFAFSYSGEVATNSGTIAESSYWFTEIIHRLHTQSLDALEKSNNSVLTRFKFPDPVKVPCEQYLLYFAQFLKDAGVDASVDLKREAGGVLFSVTPKDSSEALSKIRQALDLYLHMPSNPNSLSPRISTIR